MNARDAFISRYGFAPPDFGTVSPVAGGPPPDQFPEPGIVGFSPEQLTHANEKIKASIAKKKPPSTQNMDPGPTGAKATFNGN